MQCTPSHHSFFSSMYLRILLRNIFNACASRNMTTQVLQSYKTNDEINFLVVYSLHF